MATNNRSAIIHALNPLIEEDIRKRGFEVTFDAYVMYKTHIHEIINEIDLTEPLLLYDDIIPDLKLIVLSKWRSKSEGLKLLEELCESPHFCYMLLEIAAKSTSTTNSVAKKRLKTIIKKMESKGMVCTVVFICAVVNPTFLSLSHIAKSLRQLPVNVATVNFDFVVDVHPATGRMDSHKASPHTRSQTTRTCILWVLYRGGCWKEEGIPAPQKN